MPLSRRALLNRLSGLPALHPPAAGAIHINGNENPVGPGKRALDAILAELDQSRRYPFNSRIGDPELVRALAKKFDAKRENFVVGAGSSEVLRNAVRVFANDARHVVTANPSYGSPVTEAKKYGYECRQIPLGPDLRLDLAGMAAASRGAGLVYVCNPNNPTATVHSASAIEGFIAEVHRSSPDTLILVDEAYHDYVTDPAHTTMIPLAMLHRNLVVARTFSKAYGMAALRLGFGVGRPDTIASLSRFKLSANANVLAIAAGVASLGDPDHIERERARNARVRRFTMDFFEKAGFHATEAQTNFLFVELGRPAEEFRDACAEKKVVVARDFPPMEKTHCRISLGTMPEMRRACDVFAEVLGVEAAPAVAGGY